MPILLVGTKLDLKQHDKQPLFKKNLNSKSSSRNKLKLSILRTNGQKLTIRSSLGSTKTDTMKSLISKSVKGNTNTTNTNDTSITTNNENDKTLNEQSVTILMENSQKYEYHLSNGGLNCSSYDEPTSVSLMTNKNIKRKDCIKLKSLLNAKKYLECSCFDSKTIENVINCAIKQAYNYNKEKSIINLAVQASHLSLNPLTIIKKTNNSNNYSCSDKSNSSTLTNESIQSNQNYNYKALNAATSNIIENKSKIFSCLCCNTNRLSTISANEANL